MSTRHSHPDSRCESSHVAPDRSGGRRDAVRLASLSRLHHSGVEETGTAQVRAAPYVYVGENMPHFDPHLTINNYTNYVLSFIYGTPGAT